MSDRPSKIRRTLISCMALMLAVAAIGGAVTMAEQRGIEASPTQQAEAGAVTVGVVIGAFAVADAACRYGYTCDSASAKEQAKADALETEISVHQSGLVQNQNDGNFLQQVDNELQGTETLARVEGKQAYVRALNNGSAEAVARSKARGAVADYYSVRQQMLLNQWNVTVESLHAGRFVSENTSEMSSDFVGIQGGQPSAGVTPNTQQPYTVYANLADTSNMTTVSLINGTTHPVIGLNLDMTADDNVNEVEGEMPGTPALGYAHIDGGHYSEGSSGGVINVSKIRVKAPNTNYSPVTYLNASAYEERWNEIEQKNNQVQAELDSFINQTYASYQQGEISNEDLIDPYLGAREYDPENSSTSWAIRSTAAMGITPPENVDNIDTMTVETGNQTVSGLLMLPGNQTIQTGTTYNADTQTGQQYVLDPESGSLTEITGNYTVSEITKPDGSTRDSVSYAIPTSGATSMEEFRQRMQMLNNYSAKINARQQRLRQPGPGTGPLGIGGLGDLSTPALALIVAALAFLVARP